MTPEDIRVLVCVGPRCDAGGRGRALLAKIETALQERHADDRLTIATRDCLRLCTRDPVVRLEPSGEAFSNSDADETLREILSALAQEQ